MDLLVEGGDDLPPSTVITSIVARPDASLDVKGFTADGGEVKGMWVNGKRAAAVETNFAMWLAVIPAANEVIAYGWDKAGNVEKALQHKLLTKMSAQLVK